MATTTNAMTVDVEGFVESNRQSFDIPARYVDEARETAEIERNMHAVLDLFDDVGVSATFFFVGTVAERLPAIIAETARRGHEVASHNFVHKRVFDLEPDQFRRGLEASKAKLEDLTGEKVRGFRAPDFSITTSSLWALDVLGDLGFEYDSSIYPTGLHDVYGIDGAPATVHRMDNGLVEFPLSTVRVLGRRVPFGGGGYFRLYPLAVTVRLLRRLADGTPGMVYIHPYEVGPEIPRIDGMSAYRRFRHYYHCGDGRRRLRHLLERAPFARTDAVLRELGFIPA